MFIELRMSLRNVNQGQTQNFHGNRWTDLMAIPVEQRLRVNKKAEKLEGGGTAAAHCAAPTEERGRSDGQKGEARLG